MLDPGSGGSGTTLIAAERAAAGAVDSRMPDMPTSLFNAGKARLGGKAALDGDGKLFAA